MSRHRRSQPPRGIGVEDLPAILREQYLHAIETARTLHDPATDWEAFRDRLWDDLLRIFAIENRHEPPEGA